MSLQRTCCCGRCAYQRNCFTSAAAVPDVIQFSATTGDPAVRYLLSAPNGITLYTSTISVTFNSSSVTRPGTNDRTVTTWDVTVEIDYQADLTYPGGFQTNCRCDDNGTYSDIPAWSDTISWNGVIEYVCLDDDTVTAGSFGWQGSAPRYNLNDDLPACAAGTQDPPNPPITIDLALTNGSTNWEPGATDCTSLLTKYYDAVFQFELQQNGGCQTTTYGTPAELTIRFGWS